MPPLLISADALAPMTGNTLLHNAGLILDAGKITAVGLLPDLQNQFPNLPRTHHPGLLLPGLINAHIHLELSYQRRPPHSPPGPVRFTDWIPNLMQNYPPPELREAVITAAVQTGITESLHAGVTTVADISRNSAISRKVLAQSPIRAISFGEVVGLGKMRNVFPTLLNIAADKSHASDLLTIALSPHAPYTVEGPTLQAIITRALQQNLPLAMHLAELAEESQFLRDLSGPLGRDWDFLQKLDILDPAIPLNPNGPLRWAEQWGLLGPNGAAKKLPTLLAHLNYLNDADLTLLQQSNATIVYCPRTRQFFGHDQISPHPYQKLLAHNINLCLGTDSLASNPDLNLLQEAALLHTRDHLPATLALQLITANPALALHLPAGQLSPNTHADLTIFPQTISPSDTLESTLHTLLTQIPLPTAVYIAAHRAL